MKYLIALALLAYLVLGAGCVSMPGGETVATIRTPDGKPATDAQVVLVLPRHSVTIADARTVDDSECQRLSVDRQGRVRFTSPASAPASRLVAVHPDGYAELELRTAGAAKDVQLQQWSRVEGRYMVGDKPGAGQRISVWQDSVSGAYNPYMPSVTHDLRAMTDAEGRFTFERVPPGVLIVGKYVEWNFTTGYGGAGFTQRKRITAEPGQTVQVDLGGAGRVVTGNVFLPRELGPADGLEFGICTVVPKQLLSRNLVKATERPLTQMYPVQLAVDGSFRVVDVPPGDYTINIEVRSTTRHPARRAGDVVAAGKMEFTVPDAKGGAIQLPTIPLELRTPVPHVNDLAPDFTAKRLEGGQLKLSEFRGHYVLLDFWATWCGPCLAQTDSLKAVYDEFGKDGRLVMIGLSVDDARGAPLRYTREHAMAWNQCFLGDESAVAALYGVNTIPSIWLIGPDGKVIATKLHGDAIRAAVAKRLAK